jgi:hypothetical protein
MFVMQSGSAFMIDTVAPLPAAPPAASPAAGRTPRGNLQTHPRHAPDPRAPPARGLTRAALQTDGLESVLATLSPGDMFGADTLFGHKSVWPWGVRCAHPAVALRLSRANLDRALEAVRRRRRLVLNDSLKVLLETKRVACALINEVPLRLRS